MPHEPGHVQDPTVELQEHLLEDDRELEFLA